MCQKLATFIDFPGRQNLIVNPRDHKQWLNWFYLNDFQTSFTYSLVLVQYAVT